jgi:hypothetical protein
MPFQFSFYFFLFLLLLSREIKEIALIPLSLNAEWVYKSLERRAKNLFTDGSKNKKKAF